MAKSHDNDPVDHLLGDLEAPVMRAMWAREAATVREVRDLLSSTGRTLAYTTVMTVMRRLAGKGLLTREFVGKKHTYRSATTREGFLRAASAEQVQALIAEFGDVAIAQFLAELLRLPPERRRLLEEIVMADSAASSNNQ